MAAVSVRYIVEDVDAAIAFYTDQLGFHEDMHPAPSFAMLSRGELRLLLSAPSGAGGGGQAMPDGTRPEPGGWNRVSLEVANLAATVEELRAAGARFRNEIITGVGGEQILLEDPSGNPIELFQPTRPEAALADVGSPRWRSDSRMVAFDVLAFVRANLPPPPARVLEVGAGDGALAGALAVAGYDVIAIDPQPAGANVRACALDALDEPAASFDAAIAIVSLHHVDPLAESLRRLAEVLKPAGTVLVDEFDVAAFDRTAAAWMLERRRALSAHDMASAEGLVEEHRAHLHPLRRIVAALESHFQVGIPVRGAYLYRWDLGESFRAEEEHSIAQGQIPAVGARLVAQRTS
jgi:catechol 2,3-dioxygenase-like lactoylglutathione lyase family enzyme/uncharacterized UPF0146 family protein